MAALALTIGGAALGGALLPGGISLLGATISGAAIGGAIGGIVGAVADQALLAPDAAPQAGPRLTDVQVFASTEGAPILRVYGRFRVGPTLIWAGDIREERRRTETGGKGAPGIETTEYRYFATLALGLCEGQIAGIGRVWADGKLVDMGRLDWRLHRGGENQDPDPRIEADEGEDNTPGFRGLAYLVFEELPLEPFGNRVPQFTVEIIANASPLTAITMIPGAGEFAYDTRRVHKAGDFGVGEAENVHAEPSRADVLVALDQLGQGAPEMKRVSLVVTWHGDDLRCGACTLRPKVEVHGKQTIGGTWRVSGLSRDEAETVSLVEGKPAFGGTPSDGSVFRQIEALKDRGYAVMLHPFVMMDVPEGNGLPDPHGGEEQAQYPWRGRITCFPGPSQPGTVDKTGTAASQVAAFFGDAEPGDFSWNGAADTVAYSGPAEWSFRRLVLHYATLAAAAGGVDAFLIGSELIGLTSLRSDADTYPAVAQLKALAADVRSILGPETKIGYGADWTEFANHRPTDGSGDVFFHLDPLWSDSAIDFVGIDAYLPLADWRPGLSHLDALAGVRSPYDRLYLQGNIEGGELFDWYYASQADRDAQIRTPITDGAYGEPWIHRIKDIRSWWQNAHHDRPGGVRNADPTAWVPRSKPIWLTEFGCPAVDLGPNQPNVFVDPKSSESHLPYYSSGRRDDAIQQSYILAVFDYWQESDNNPHSEIYDGRMVDKDRLYAWTWDARPYPQFPRLESVWADADNWRRGHWLTGRMGGAVLAEDIIVDIAEVAGVPIRVPPLPAVVKGYQIDRIMSPREALEPLFAALDLDGGESDGFVWVIPRGASPVETFGAEDLVAGDGGDFKLVRGQESELPLSVKLGFTDIDRDYRQGAVESRRLRGSSLRVSEVRLPVAIQQSEAREIADRMLRTAHVGRERADIVLPPRALAYDPGDVIALELNGRTTAWRIDSIGFELGRPTRLVRCDPDVDPPVEEIADESEPPLPAVPTTPVVEVMDLPLLSDSDATPHAPWIAAWAEPFLGAALYRSPTGTGFTLDAVAEDPAVIGRLAFDFYAGPVWRWDRVNDLHVDLVPGAVLQSRQAIDVFEGANAAAIRTPSGEWEILQWRDAELVSPGRYRLSILLRGQRGTEAAMGTPTPAGARFVLLDESLARSKASLGERGRERVERYGPASMPLDDEAFAQRTNTIRGIGLRPYAPVHVRGELDHATHDWHIRFVRRTRIDGDGWEAIEVPLAEEAEAYRLEILTGAGGAVLRTVELASPSFTYTAAMQVADFGAVQWNFFARIAQLSRAFGAGTATEALVWDR